MISIQFVLFLLAVLAVGILLGISLSVGRKGKSLRHLLSSMSKVHIPHPGQLRIKSTSSTKGEDPRHLTLSNETGEPLIEIAPSSSQTPDSCSGGTALPAEVPLALRSLIGDLPPAVSNAFDMGSTQYRVVFKPDLLKGLKNGNLEMMKSNGPAGGIRLNVINGKTKRVVGQGSIISSGKWKQCVSGSFQIVSFIAGQDHLAEISQQLDQIKTIAEDIRNHLKDKRRGALKGKIEYMKELLQTIRKGHTSTEEVITLNNQLETIERETLEDIEALKEEICRRRQNIEDLDPEEFTLFWRLHKNKEATLDEIERYTSTARQLETALWVRLIAAELKTYLPVDHQLVARRRKSVRDMIKREHARHQASMEAAKEKACQLKGSIATEETTQVARQEAEEKVVEIFASLNARLESMDEIAEKGASVLQERNQLLQKELELELIKSDDGSYQARMVD